MQKHNGALVLFGGTSATHIPSGLAFYKMCRAYWINLQPKVNLKCLAYKLQCES